MRIKGKGKIRPGNHENICSNEVHTANELGVCVSSTTHPSVDFAFVNPGYQQPPRVVMRQKRKLDDTSFHVDTGLPNALVSESSGHPSINGNEHLIFLLR